MKLLETINQACGTLPDGYEVAIRLERGAAWVELEIADDSGDSEVLNIDDGGEGLVEGVKEAVRQAISHHVDGEI